MATLVDNMTMAVATSTNKRTRLELNLPELELEFHLPSPEISLKHARWSDTAPPPTEYSSEKTLKAPSPRCSPALVMARLDQEKEGKEETEETEETEEKEEAQNSVEEAQASAVDEELRLSTQSAVEKRFTDAQASARSRGNDPSLKWRYDANDELTGATCGDATFSREELLQLSSCWAGR